MAVTHACIIRNKLRPSKLILDYINAVVSKIHSFKVKAIWNSKVKFGLPSKSFHDQKALFFEKTKHLTSVSITTKLRFCKMNLIHGNKSIILRLLIVLYTGRSSSADTTVTTSFRVASSLPEMASLTLSCSSLPPLVSWTLAPAAWLFMCRSR